MRYTVLLVLVATLGCTSIVLQPVEPPGSQIENETVNKKHPPPPNIDGSVYYDNNTSRTRSAALARMGEYCGGPYVVVEERDTLAMTVWSFPLPVERHTIYFKCEDESM